MGKTVTRDDRGVASVWIFVENSVSGPLGRERIKVRLREKEKKWEGKEGEGKRRGKTQI